LLQENKIILGTVQFGLNYGINNSIGKPTQNLVNQILDKAFENNILLLDTAEAYGDSQEVIGAYHKQSKNKFKVITKYSSARTDLPVNIKDRIISNLKTLEIERLYCYMFHNYADFKSYYAAFEKEILELKQKGLIQKVGVSVYTNKELEDLLNYDEIDVVQIPFNLLDNTQQRLDVLMKSKAKGIEIHTRSAFLQGLFFKEAKELPFKIQALKPYLEVIQNTAIFNKLTVAELALNYAYQQETINNVLIGVDSVEQLEQNLQALKVEITPNLMAEMNAVKVEEVSLLNPSNWN
jgi:aryl-alcohol dehydrogenase-like predicted oxidoreductase